MKFCIVKKVFFVEYFKFCVLYDTCITLLILFYLLMSACVHTLSKQNNLNLPLVNPYPAGTESDLSLCHQYRARPACTTMQSDQAL